MGNPLKACPKCGEPHGLIRCETCHSEYLANPLVLSSDQLTLFKREGQDGGKEQ